MPTTNHTREKAAQTFYKNASIDCMRRGRWHTTYSCACVVVADRVQDGEDCCYQAGDKCSDAKTDHSILPYNKSNAVFSFPQLLQYKYMTADITDLYVSFSVYEHASYTSQKF